MMKNFILLIVAVHVHCFWAGKAFAQPSCKIEHYSSEDGLSHDIITCMFKDRQGYMWFGTWDGINRFDGHNFTSFKSAPGDRSLVKNDRVDQIVEDNVNHLWIKSYDGQVYRFHKGTEQFVPLATIIGLKKKIAFDRILSTKDNMLWVGTFGHGLIALPTLDQDRSVHYSFSASPQSSVRLPSDTVNFLYRESSTVFWIGTPHGLVKLLRDKAGKFSAQELHLQDARLKNFTAATSAGGKLYFGTADGQLLIADRGIANFKILPVTKGSINALLTSKDAKNLYVTTSTRELVMLNLQNKNAAIQHYDAPAMLLSMFEDKGGNIWLEPEKKGVVRFDIDTRRFATFTQQNDAYNYTPRNHFKLFDDKNGRVWCVLRDGGFGYYDEANSKFNYFYNKPGARDRRFSNLVAITFYDPSGVMWLHTDQRGLEKVIFHPNDLKQHLLVDPGFFKSQNEVRGLLCDRKNRLWVGAKSGRLYLLEKGKEIKIDLINRPKNGLGAVYTIFQDKAGAVWLGTKENGLYKATPTDDTETRYRLQQFLHDANNHSSLSSDQVYAIAQDPKGQIWVATFDKGLNVAIPTSNGYTFRHYGNGQNGYPQDFSKIRHLTFDAQGRLWAATTDGLVIAQRGSRQNYTFKTFSKIPGDVHSIGNNDIQYIFRDHSHRMWLATSGGGLNLAIEDKKNNSFSFKIFSTRNGLANDYVLNCQEDRQHNLWLATKSSLTKFDPEKGRFQNFNSYDGVPNDGFSEGACQQTQDGQMVFGTIRGYLTFDPAQIKDHPIQANIVFTGLQINNEDMTIATPHSVLQQNIDNTQAIRLKYNQNIISIDHTVLDHRSSSHLSYSYRLQGFDTTWHDNKDQRRVTYTNLPPGKYQFEVRCTDVGLYTNVPSKKLNITILPPPWKTWWAYLSYAILLAIALETTRRIVFTMIKLRHRIALERKMTDLKMAFFTNVSHEFRTPLTLILNPIDEVLKQEELSAQSKEYLSIVRRNTNRMIRFVNQLLDLRKSQSGSAKLSTSRVNLVSFIKEIGECFAEIARTKQIVFRVQSNDDQLEMSIDTDKMETVVYNLLSNSFKFATTGDQITITVDTNGQQDKVTIQVTDQGCGVPEEDLANIFQLYHESHHPATQNLKGTGIGLALSKELVELHGGTISAINGQQGGLVVTIELPVKESTATTPKAIMLTTHENSFTIQDDQPLKGKITEHLTADGLNDTNASLILLVEDNEDMRRFLATQLSTTYRVRTAKDGAEGLAMAKKLQPDLILSDIMMPRMDGIEMLVQLKHELSTSHIPVILLSAKSAVESQIKGLRYGADLYISKPFDNDLLLASVENILVQRKKLVDRIVAGNKVVDLSPGQVMVTSKDEIFLQKVISIVEENMADTDFNIDTVAEMINMARATFFKKFKSLTQQAPVEFVRDMRLKRAKQYMDAGAGNITEISYKVGFTSAKYFSTCFKAKYELSPSDYLRTSKAEHPVTH